MIGIARKTTTAISGFSRSARNKSMNCLSQPARFAFVTGHECGDAAFRAILDLPEYGSALTCSLLVCLDKAKSNVTSGYADVGPFARSRGIQVEYVRSIKSDQTQRLLAHSSPDYLLIIGWSELAPAAVLDIPKQKRASAERHAPEHASIGIHPSLLPEGRGRAPIPWAILKGLTRTGVTAFLLEESADAGGIIEQLEIPIHEQETATSLFDKVRTCHMELGRRVGRRMAARSLAWRPQDDRMASSWPRRRPEDGKIDFSKAGHEVDRLVRALTPPFPGAFISRGDEHIRVHKIEVLNIEHGQKPGTVLVVDPYPVVAINNGAIRLLSFDQPRQPFEVKSVLE